VFRQLLPPLPLITVTAGSANSGSRTSERFRSAGSALLSAVDKHWSVQGFFGFSADVFAVAVDTAVVSTAVLDPDCCDG
jgi:hypothetical protein